MLKSVGKSVGKHVLRTGVNVASDLLEGAPLKESLAQRSKAAGADLLTSLSDRLSGNQHQQHSTSKKKRVTQSKSRGKSKKRSTKHKRDIFS
jgi:hypothetical protein